jgi:hypothetical protein
VLAAVSLQNPSLAPAVWGQKEADAVANGEPKPGQYFSEKWDAFLRMCILVTFDGLLLLFWMGVAWSIHVAGEWVEKNGVHEKCVFLLKDIGPWFILAIALLHLAIDVVQAIKLFWREMRK